mgnify:CR=1 FL=1
MPKLIKLMLKLSEFRNKLETTLRIVLTYIRWSKKVAQLLVGLNFKARPNIYTYSHFVDQARNDDWRRLDKHYMI